MSDEQKTMSLEDDMLQLLIKLRYGLNRMGSDWGDDMVEEVDRMLVKVRKSISELGDERTNARTLTVGS